MTAPDRIWLNMGSSHVVVVNGKKSTSRLAFEEEPNGEGLPEYLRKGAFPVEEVERIRELLITAIGLGDATRTAGLHQGRAAQSVEALGRILSLLESDDE